MSRPRRKVRFAFSIRVLMGLVVLSALVSTFAAWVLSVREFERRGPSSEALLRPILNYHDYSGQSDLRCTGTNRGTADGHLLRALGHLSSAVRQTWRLRQSLDSRHGRMLWRFHVRDQFAYFRTEIHFARDAYQLAMKQKIMAAYHARLIKYYQRLRAEHRIELPPLPPEILDERLATRDELRRICRDPALELDPEPPDELNPAIPKKPVPPTIWIGDSF